MTVQLSRTPQWLKQKDVFSVFTDFASFVTGGDFTSTLTDSGSVTVANGVGGIAPILPSDGSVADNDEGYVHSTNAIFTIAAQKALYAECRIQFAEANTDDANILFGFCSAAVANALVDDGAGPPSSYTGAVFFKVDGANTWNVETSLSTTQDTTTLTAANSLDKTLKTAGGSTYQVLGVEIVPVNTTQATVIFTIDGVVVATKLMTYTSAAAMRVIVGVKNGGANLETLNADYLGAFQLR